MNLGKQIKKYRSELSLSQEALAQKIFVSRQTVSNWENDKSYPDINSLVLLSEVFSVSIDKLIKGDVEEMKEQVSHEERNKFEKLSQKFAILFIAMIVLPVPMASVLGYIGLGIWAVLAAITFYVAILLEKEKKKYNVQTFKEIIAFSEGKTLDEIAKAREEGKKSYQRILFVVGAAVLTLAIAFILNYFV